jgi:hypothetical protein
MYEAVLLASSLLAACVVALRYRRVLLYRGLHRRIDHIVAYESPADPARWADLALPSFEDRLAVVADLLPPEHLARIAAQIERLSSAERSYVPAHKKGGTIAYETLCTEAPAVVALYHSPPFHALLSRILGVAVKPTPLDDQSSCSVLIYERPGDHIGWHYDYNFYNGRHFTVLLAIVNRNIGGDGLSSARLHARIGSEDREIPTPPNQLVVFEGAHVLHKASPISEGERRIVLSMTFATDTRSTIARGIARRVKDTAFFGIRALWT